MTIRAKLSLLAAVFIFPFATSTYVSAEDRFVAKVPIKGRVLQTLDEAGIDILAMNRDGTVDVWVNQKELDFVFTLGLPVSVVQTPDMTSSEPGLPADLGLYHTYAEMETELNNLVLTYPTLTDLTVAGTSLEGRNIYVLKISDNPTVDEAEAEVLYMGNHHARELMSVEIPLRFAGYLLANYGIDGTVTAMVDSREIFFVPMVNPDGHVYVEANHTGSSNGWWRKNRRNNGNGTFGVDLNRNYSFMWGFDNLGSSPSTSSAIYRGTGPFSEPETTVISNFINTRSFSVGFSYHSYGELLLFGWGYKFDYTPDHEVFLNMGNQLASTNGYLVGNPAMGAIYITNGDTDDWAYGEDVTKPSFFLYTPEVNSSAEGGFCPPPALIDPTFNLLLPMNMELLNLAENPHQVVGPERPTMFVVDNSNNPDLTVSWSAPNPSDPNPTVDYEVIEFENLGALAQDGANATSPLLWNYNGFSASTARAFEGMGSYFSGATNNTVTSLAMTEFYSVTSPTDEFTAKFWYDIETDWDYAYVQVSTDGGVIWTNITGDITTTTNPNGANRGNGITGNSGGWTDGTFSLAAYDGQDVLIRVAYQTDAIVLGEGMYVDLPGPVTTYDTKQVVASNHIGTSIVVQPSASGNYTYQVRANDAEGDVSHWSNLEGSSVTIPTAIGDVTTYQTALGTNYPNPFNPITQIPYSVGSDQATDGTVAVSLAIYNVAGQRVATLVDRAVPPGDYLAVWRGNNDSNTSLPSGVYFARLEVAGETVPVRKLVMLK